jgi:hypothetical protein
MDHWNVLELDRDADERSIKRQYARLLKVNRPDDDPEAFQRLREAYEYALSWARMRFDEEQGDGLHEHQHDAQGEGQSLADPTRAEFYSEAVDLAEPLLLDRGPSSAELTTKLAADLALHTTPENLQQQHQQALEQACDGPFQQALLARCLLTPEANIALLNAAVAHLHWLTPWQSALISPDQRARLAEALLDSEHGNFQALLARGEERELFSRLQILSRQPWLSALERREQLYRWVLIFLHNTQGWTPALFDRICTLFGWETNSIAHPQPEFIWYRLIQRCEQHAYLQRLQRLLIRGSTVTEEQAAILVLKPPATNAGRVHAARNANADVWEACELLCNQLTHRYPDLLEYFPDADLEGWRTLRTRPLQSRRWIWIGWLLMAVICVLPQRLMASTITTFADVAALLGIYPLLMTGASMMFMRVWGPVADALQSADEWLSQKLLPDSLSWPGSQALLIRHGVPMLLCGWLTSARADTWALVCYSTLMLLWIFASPGRYPQAFERFRKKNMGLVRKAKRGPIIFIAVVIIVSAYKIITEPGWQTPAPAVHRASVFKPLDCSSQEALDLMDRECKHAMTSRLCQGATVEQKIARCENLQAKEQLPPGKSSL